MAPSPPSLQIPTVDSTSRLFQRLDLIERHFDQPPISPSRSRSQNLISNMDYLNTDQVMDVPDTPDRLTPQRRIDLAVSNNSENGELSERGIVNGLVGNYSLSANDGNNAMIYSHRQRNLEIHDQSKPGSSIFPSVSDNVSVSDSSKKSARLEDSVSKKRATNLFEQTQRTDSILNKKKIPLHIPASSHWSNGHMSHGILLGSGSSGVTEKSVSGVEVQEGSRGKMVGCGQKFPSNISVPSRSRDTKKFSLVQGSSNSGNVLSARFPQRFFTIQDDDHVMDVDSMPEHTRKHESSYFFGTSKNQVSKGMGPGLSLPEVAVRDARSHSHASEGFSSLHNGAKSYEVPWNAHKREIIDGVLNGTNMIVDPVARFNGCNKGTEIDSSCDSQPKTVQAASVPLQSVTSPQRTARRKLVRNGVISPFNIAKCKSSSGNHHKNDTNAKEDGNGKASSIEPSDGVSSSQIHIISPGSEENQIDRTKGKGLLVDLMQENECVAGTRSSSRGLLTHREEDFDAGDASRTDFRSAEEIGGWRGTRNHSKMIFLASSNENNLSMRSSSYDLNHECGLEDRDQVMVLNDGPDSSENGSNDPVSVQRAVSNSNQVEACSSIKCERDLENDRHRGKQKLMKRLRKSSSVRDHPGECSTSTSDDPEVSHILPPVKSSNSRPARTRNSQRRGILGPIIEVDELYSPETRRSNSQSSCNPDSNARDRQVEADEILARQLQEQLYHEFPGTGVGEIDSSIAWALQHEEDVDRFPFAESPHVRVPRDVSSRELYRNRRSQSFQNSSARLTNRIRGSSSARMTQLRRNFHGRSPVASSRGTSFRFPPNMDLEMAFASRTYVHPRLMGENFIDDDDCERLDILEAMEATFGDRNGMRMVDPLLHVQRDFNENDYEMLLALDENNHRHVGASDNQINSLPQSTVQSDNFEEACVICLETPSTGDTIRHLPCLHKFHKECIDPWLRRKTSCPICKSCIT